MDLVHLADVLREHDGGPLKERRFIELQRSRDLSTGVYLLPAGQPDPQQPHTEDEIYHVLRGRATLRVGDETRPVGPGAVAFVPAGAPHRFEDIEEDLVSLVVFAPAYRSRAPR
jgi:mannose-6-phosphate isomerase-like protein (cupin superfamily)